MKIGPLFKWFGSKWLSAKRYPPPKHSLIVEPFAGGAGYSLNYCDRKVVIWEDDPNVAKLWRWLIKEATGALIREIPIDLPAGFNIRSTWFIDGPYIFNYRYRADLPEFDFEQLSSLEQTINRDSQVIVCEAKCKKTGAIPGYLPFVESHRSITSRRKQTQSHHSAEVVYVRG